MNQYIFSFFSYSAASFRLLVKNELSFANISHTSFIFHFSLLLLRAFPSFIPHVVVFLRFAPYSNIRKNDFFAVAAKFTHTICVDYTKESLAMFSVVSWIFHSFFLFLEIDIDFFNSKQENISKDRMEKIHFKCHATPITVVLRHLHPRRLSAGRRYRIFILSSHDEPIFLRQPPDTRRYFAYFSPRSTFLLPICASIYSSRAARVSVPVDRAQ